MKILEVLHISDIWGCRVKGIEIPNDMARGTIYSSNNSGELVIVGYRGSRSVTVRFIETGYETVVRADNIRAGGVKDRLRPSVFGVGFVGEGHHNCKVNLKLTKAYQTWHGMLERCYDHKLQERHPTYIGCSVTPEWHNFQNFAEWFEKNYIDDHHLDKDIKIKGNKVYSPETCLFVSPAENAVEANAKHYKFLSPDGDIIEVYNLRAFCRDNGLHNGSMSMVHSGGCHHHKQWRKAQ